MAIIELGTDTRDALPEREVEWFPEPAAARTDPAPAATGRPRRAALTDPLSGGWALFLTVAWVTIFTIGVALEPAPANEDAMPLLGAVLMSGLMTGWVVMAAGFAHRRRYGAAGSLGAAGVLVAMTIACPLSGHHAGIGAWWWFEVGGSLTLVAASRAALRA
ncbi:MAG TPA: hypothetical protein VK848_00550, partial [Acidimicrobiia bacterium]|nr:hypothetical protein [Acidimicrobiia bacterium]